MATTFGFFNAKKVGDDYDRKYSADNLAEYFDPIVGSGVSVNEENGYQLKAQSGLNVLLESGFAWIKGYYIRDTTATMLTFEAAPSSQSRYDAVILRLSKANRTVNKIIIKGAESPTPQLPDLTRTADTYELMLGYVVRKAGTSSITQDMIVDTRSDPSLCGLIDTFAARLVPDGSITTVKLANGGVTTAKVAASAITRAKLAKDALYSPLEQKTSSYTLTSIDIGKTILSDSSSPSDVRVITLNASNNDALPIGTEFAIMAGNTGTTKLTVEAGIGVRGNKDGDVIASDGITVTIPRYGMIALKKFYAKHWLITGVFEVVS